MQLYQKKMYIKEKDKLVHSFYHTINLPKLKRYFTDKVRNKRPFLTLIHCFSTTYIHLYHAFKSIDILNFFILKTYRNNFKEYRERCLALILVFWSIFAEVVSSAFLYKWQVVYCLFTIQNICVFWYMFFYIDTFVMYWYNIL